MPAELVFYTNPMSRGGIVHWMLEEMGVAYDMEILEYGTTMKAPAYLAINPNHPDGLSTDELQTAIVDTGNEVIDEAVEAHPERDVGVGHGDQRDRHIETLQLREDADGGGASPQGLDD